LSNQLEAPKVEAHTEVLSATTSVMMLINKHAADLPDSERYAMYKTIECESGFVAQQSRHMTASGDRERSFGIVQINLPSHPTVTYEQAMDNEFSVIFMADKFRKGQQRIWTCYRKLVTSGQV
jgi:hypothetical protein